MKQILTVFLLSTLLCLSGCAAEEKGGSSANGASENNSELSSATELSSGESEINFDVGDAVSQKWAEEWEAITSDFDMVQPKAYVFTAELNDDFDYVVAIVYPEYKTTATVLYGVKGNDIQKLGKIPSGWQFEVLDNGSSALLHVVYILTGAGDVSEIDDYYYTVSKDSTELIARYGRTETDGTGTSWFRYTGNVDENGNGITEELTVEDYNTAIADITAGYSVTKTIDLDNNGDYEIDQYYEFNDDLSGFAEYVADAIGN